MQMKFVQDTIHYLNWSEETNIQRNCNTTKKQFFNPFLSGLTETMSSEVGTQLILLKNFVQFFSFRQYLSGNKNYNNLG